MWTTPRQYPRFKATLPVALQLDGSQAPLRAQTQDISLGGFYVEMTSTQQVSTDVDITLWIGDNKIQAKGVVVSNHPAFGNGIKFTDLEGAGKEHLSRFLECLQPHGRCVQSGDPKNADQRHRVRTGLSHLK